VAISGTTLKQKAKRTVNSLIIRVFLF